MTTAYINRIGTAVPPHDVHEAFVVFARTLLADERTRVVFDRMAERAGIEHRYSFLCPGEPGATRVDAEGFYCRGTFPGTGARMARYQADSVTLAVQAIGQLGIEDKGITHLLVASCTGFTAPGLDQLIAERLGLGGSLERTLVGFMGCYAAVPALRSAHHIIRSDPSARVLVVNLELCSLHMQEVSDLERVLSFLLFGDGAAAALVTGDAEGIALHDFRAKTIPDTQDMITWRIGDQGFDMHLSGKVPARIATALRADVDRNDMDGLMRGQDLAEVVHWAVHAGGRTVLDAVEVGLRLPPDALRHCRAVLRDVGNISSATLMFVLARILAQGVTGPGIGMAFGPGLCAETFRFSRL